jgi:hypothetical protein
MVIKGNVKREKGEAESRKKKVKVNQLPSTISMTCGQLKGLVKSRTRLQQNRLAGETGVENENVHSSEVHASMKSSP